MLYLFSEGEEAMTNKFTSENLEQLLREAKANLAIEGIELTREEEDLVKANLLGELDDQDFHIRAIELAKKASIKPKGDR